MRLLQGEHTVYASWSGRQIKKTHQLVRLEGLQTLRIIFLNCQTMPSGSWGGDRHVLEHGGDYYELNDLDELELLTSDMYEELFHPILKALIYSSDPRGN